MPRRRRSAISARSHRVDPGGLVVLLFDFAVRVAALPPRLTGQRQTARAARGRKETQILQFTQFSFLTSVPRTLNSRRRNTLGVKAGFQC